MIRDFPIIKVSLTNKVLYAGAERPSFIVRSGKPSGSVANLGILSQDLGIFLGHWDFHGIFILRIRPWDFSWDFSEFRK